MPDRLTATATIMALTGSRADRLHHLLAGRGGRIVPSADDVLVAFEAASQAALAATAVQDEVARAWPHDDVRVGIASGDVVWEGDDCFGPPVVMAARLCDVAAAGQTLVTDTVRALSGNRGDVRFEHIGPVVLRGLPTTVDVFEVAADRATVADASTPPAAPPMPLALAGTSGHPFVGRGETLALMDRAWSDAARDAGRLVLVGGEAGAGKTRLAGEFARRVHGRGAAVLYGGCDDDLALPYQPWVQALDPILPALVRADDWLTVELAPLSSLSVNVDRFVPPGTAAVSPDPDAERYRRYRAFGRLLDAAAARWPTLLVLDDLHWAGPQTLALLRHLPRGGLPRGVMILGMFRDTADEVSEPLASCLADLRRVDGAQRTRLGGLDAPSVERFVGRAAGGVIDDGLRRVARVLADRTNGNAFYLGELWRHLITTGAVVQVDGRYVVRSEAPASDVPDSVREVVAARLGRLSPAARHVVETAAIAGHRIQLPVLAAAADPAASDGSTDVTDALEELVAAGLLSSDNGPARAYRFTHAIVRDTVETTIAATSRSRLHLDVARAQEAVHAADLRPVLAELARHYVAAVPDARVEQAVHYGRRAAAQAVRAAAYDEAVAHVQSVLDLDPAPSERDQLLVELGAALLRNGFYADSQAAYAEAFELAVEHGHVEHAAAAAIGFELATHFPGLSGEPAVELLTRAIEVAGDAQPAVSLRLRASYGRALAVAGRGAEGAAVAELARAEALALGDLESLSIALQALITAGDDPARQLADSEALAELAARLDDLWTSSYASGTRIHALVQLGRCDDAADGLERHRVLSASGRFSTFQFMVHAFEALLELAAGNFELAEAAAERAHEHDATKDSPFADGVYGLQMFAIRKAQGRLAEVAPVLRVLAARPETPGIWRPGLAALYTELGLPDEAGEVFRSLAPERFSVVPRDAIWPACATFLGEAALAVGDEEDLAVLYEELLPLRGRNLLAGFTMCFGPADRLLGALAARLGRHRDAEEHFAAGLDLATRSRSPVWTAEVQTDWAIALAAGGEHQRARDLAAQARTTAGMLEMRGLLRRIDAIPVGVAVADAAVTDLAARPSPPAHPDGLSAREVDVLRCVAAGLSNREIGVRLFISQNTVANHVRSILQKTGCANRTEAAGYAVRHGLAELR